MRLNLSVRAVFIDFAIKAFDYLDHNILVAKLTEFGLIDVIIRCKRVHVFIFATSASACKDWRRDVRLAGDGCWYAAIGSFLWPLTFIVLVDSLRASCMTHKFVDDTKHHAVRDCRQVSHKSHASFLR